MSGARRGRPRVAPDRDLRADAAALQAWRARYGLTQEQTAQQLGKSVALIRAVEQQRLPLNATMRHLMATLDLLERYEGR